MSFNSTLIKKKKKNKNFYQEIIILCPVWKKRIQKPTKVKFNLTILKLIDREFDILDDELTQTYLLFLFDKGLF